MAELVDIFIGRQPIFDRQKQVYAYELLFRANTDHNEAVILEPDVATAQVMMNLFGDMGLKNVVGERKAFINFTEAMLLNENRPFFPRNQVVIEVLEDVKVSVNLIAALKKLRKLGYRIALDDYIFNPELAELEQYADLIKVEILDVPPIDLARHVPRLKSQGIRLLAEKVETQQQYDFCHQLGFDFFQGYFFSKPTIIKGRSLPPSRLAIIRLMSQVYDPNIDMKTLAETISRDVSLSQKLLKFATTQGGQYQVTSIQDVVLRFGLNRLQSWTSLLMLSGTKDKPPELFRTALIRAKFCELVGRQANDFSQDSYFTVGLFSCLDALMDQSLDDLLKELNFERSIKQALLEEHGSLGVALKAVKAIEQGQTDFELPKKLTPSELSRLYLLAMEFSQNMDLGA